MGESKEVEDLGEGMESQTKALPSLEERVTLLELENSRLRQEVQDIRLKLDSLLKPRNAATLLEGLTPTQQSVLESIRQLPSESMDEASKQLATLEGQPFTEAFSKSFTSVLREKQWSVLCEVCGVPAAAYWNTDSRYAENGRGFFSHPTGEKDGAKAHHGNLTTIPAFKLTPRRRDKRLKKT